MTGEKINNVKQRSLNLDDHTYALLRDYAAAGHYPTLSEALRTHLKVTLPTAISILQGLAEPSGEAASARGLAHNLTGTQPAAPARAPVKTGASGIVLPDDSVETFKGDPKAPRSTPAQEIDLDD